MLPITPLHSGAQPRKKNGGPSGGGKKRVRPRAVPNSNSKKKPKKSLSLPQSKHDPKSAAAPSADAPADAKKPPAASTPPLPDSPAEAPSAKSPPEKSPPATATTTVTAADVSREEMARKAAAVERTGVDASGTAETSAVAPAGGALSEKRTDKRAFPSDPPSVKSVAATVAAAVADDAGETEEASAVQGGSAGKPSAPAAPRQLPAKVRVAGSENSAGDALSGKADVVEASPGGGMKRRNEGPSETSPFLPPEATAAILEELPPSSDDELPITIDDPVIESSGATFADATAVVTQSQTEMLAQLQVEEGAQWELSLIVHDDNDDEHDAVVESEVAPLSQSQTETPTTYSTRPLNPKIRPSIAGEEETGDSREAANERRLRASTADAVVDAGAGVNAHVDIFGGAPGEAAEEESDEESDELARFAEEELFRTAIAKASVNNARSTRSGRGPPTEAAAQSLRGVARRKTRAEKKLIVDVTTKTLSSKTKTAPSAASVRRQPARRSRRAKGPSDDPSSAEGEGEKAEVDQGDPAHQPQEEEDDYVPDPAASDDPDTLNVGENENRKQIKRTRKVKKTTKKAGKGKKKKAKENQGDPAHQPQGEEDNYVPDPPASDDPDAGDNDSCKKRRKTRKSKQTKQNADKVKIQPQNASNGNTYRDRLRGGGSVHTSALLSDDVQIVKTRLPRVSVPSEAQAEFMKRYYKNPVEDLGMSEVVGGGGDRSLVSDSKGETKDGEGTEEDEKKEEVVKTLQDYCTAWKDPEKLTLKQKREAAKLRKEQKEKEGTLKGEVGADSETHKGAANDNGERAAPRQQPFAARMEGEEAAPAVEDVQVEIVDGEIVIRESTLVVNARVSTNQVDKEFGDAVEEENDGLISATYSSFRTVEKSNRWTVDETRRFYRTLRQCGTDFSTMEYYFEGRSRRQLKCKFKSEQKKNPRLIDLAMYSKTVVPLDLSVFGQDLVIPDEVPQICIDPPKGGKSEGENITGKDTAENSSETPSSGGAEEAGGENGVAAKPPNEERTFDHLFDDEGGGDGIARKEMGGDADDVQRDSSAGNDPNENGRGAKSSSSSGELSSEVGGDAAKDDNAAAAAKDVADAAIPLAPIIGGAKAGKSKTRFRARFKSKGKGPKKATPKKR